VVTELHSPCLVTPFQLPYFVAGRRRDPHSGTPEEGCKAMDNGANPRRALAQWVHNWRSTDPVGRVKPGWYWTAQHSMLDEQSGGPVQ
jgi:hypothetical protein